MEKIICLHFKGGEISHQSDPVIFFFFYKVVLKQTTLLHAVSIHRVLKCHPLLLTHELLPNEILILDG